MDQRPIGELFVAEGLVSRDGLEAALREKARTGRKLGAVLVDLGLVAEEKRLEVLGAQLGLEYVLPGGYPEAPARLDPAPKAAFLKHYGVVPLSADGGVLKAAFIDPADPYPIEALEASTGLRVEPLLGSPGDIASAIDSCYGGEQSVDKIIEGMDERDETFEIEDVEGLAEAASEAPVINLVNLLIQRAAEKGASDVHLEPFEDSVHVRYRVDGILYKVEALPRKLQPAISSRIKIMAKLNIAERRLPQDGRIKFLASRKEMDIRVSTIPTLWGESVVMRLLDPAGVMSLESVGFTEGARSSFESLIRQPHGMLLVTGPTGSGKSTTLYAALTRIDTSAKKVVTIEDPVEYNLPGVNQIHVKPRIGLTFANGLRSIVRQDPDVIMVGEIRDRETADIAIHSALTGHLILSTLHTNDAPGAVTRLVDMGVEGYLISSCLLGVLAQRLVRVICPSCKVPYAPDMDSIAELLPGTGASGAGITAYRGSGCGDCGNTGYRGRTGIFELMVVTEEIRQLMVEKKSSSEIRRKAVEQGMTTLREDGWRKVLAGITTIEEVTRVTLDQ